MKKNSQPIKHIFLLMLENHSFDNIFGFSGIPGIYGLTGNESNSYLNPVTHKNEVYPVSKGGMDFMPVDPGHEFLDTLEQLCFPQVKYDPKKSYPTINNSGFVTNYATSSRESTKWAPSPPKGDFGNIMKCFDTQVELPVIYQLATEFAICDQWFASIPGPTWPNRFFAYAASSSGLDDSPKNPQILLWEQPWLHKYLGVHFQNGSLFDNISSHQLEYRIYQDKTNPLGMIPCAAALQNISLLDVRSFYDDFTADLKQDYPYAFTLIEPNYGDLLFGTYRNGSSQHPMDGMHGGEALIKATYEAIRNSPLWENSLLIITYDEHGGFYDHCPPPAVKSPGDGYNPYTQHHFDFSRLGMRVPAVVVSPYIKKATLDHTVYDHSSILKTTETTFKLPTLTRRDKTAQGLNHLLTNILRTDCPVKLNNPAPEKPIMELNPLSAIEQAEFDNSPLPRTGNINGFLFVGLKTEHELSSGTQAESADITNQFKQISTRGEARDYLNGLMEKVEGRKKELK